MIHFVPISDRDTIGAAEALLAEGFGPRHGFFGPLLRRPQPEWAPHRGLLLQAGGRYTGVILCVFSEQTIAGDRRRACNLSSWFIRQPHRAHSLRMLKSAVARKDTIYTSYTPSDSLQRILPVLGFRRMDCRVVASLPLMNGRTRSRGVRVRRWREASGGLSETQTRLASAHEAQGCLVLSLVDGETRHALILRSSWIWRRGLPLKIAKVVYCGDYDLLRRAIEPLHRLLALRGVSLVVSYWPGGAEPVAGKTSRAPFFSKGTESPLYLQPVYSELSHLPI